MRQSHLFKKNSLVQINIEVSIYNPYYINICIRNWIQSEILRFSIIKNLRENYNPLTCIALRVIIFQAQLNDYVISEGI